MKILIQKCSDPARWYADKVGQYVPFLEDCGNEYKSLQDPDPAMSGHRFINFVLKTDCVLVENSDDR